MTENIRKASRAVGHAWLRFQPRLLKRVWPFGDLTAWVLLVASLGPLALVDFRMMRTVAQWTLMSLAFAGITVVLTRLFLPQVDLAEFVEQAKGGNVAAAVVVGAVAFLLGIVLLSVVLWAKA